MHVVQVWISAAFLIRPSRIMPPKITGNEILERWRTFIAEHKTTPVESGGAGHALAIFTRQKLAAGHLSKSEIAELNRLKREASRASSTNNGDAHPAVAPGVGAEYGAAGDSGVEQPVDGEHVVAQSAKASAGSNDSNGVKQPAAAQRRRGTGSGASLARPPAAIPKAYPPRGVQADKEVKGKVADAEGGACRQVSAEGRPKDTIALQSSGVPQSAAVQVSKKARLDRSAPSAPAQKKDDDKVLLLQLKRPHYDAIKHRRKLWEARPLRDGECKGQRQSIFDRLAQVGRTVVLQSGAGTNDRVRIAEVRRYTTEPFGDKQALRDMVVDLGADLLPDAANYCERTKIYTDLYGHSRCLGGFVAMRLELPGSASTDTTHATGSSVRTMSSACAKAREEMGWPSRKDA